METASITNRIRRAALTCAVTFRTKRLIVFLTPGYEHRGGGVLSIAAIYRESAALRRLHQAKVTLCAVPGDDPLFFKYSWFKNRDYLLDLDSVLKSCERLDYLLLHIPEYAVNQVLDWLNSASATLLHNVREVRLNVLLQNIDCVQGQNVSELKRFGTVTCTTAHEAYTNSATREAMGVPLHRLGCCTGPEFYSRSRYQDKEPLLIVSPDESPAKQQVLGQIARAFPELRVQIIQNLSYEAYKKLIRRAKWSLTFGEGLDAYFAEQVWSGGVAFAVFNDRYFTPAFATLETVYPSWEALLDRMPADLRRLDEPVGYTRAWRGIYDLLNNLYGTDRFRENLRKFYRGEYEDYSPTQAPPPPAATVDVNRETLRMERLSAEAISKISLRIRDVPQAIKVAAHFWLGAEVTNATNEPLYAAPPYPVSLAYHWLEKASRQMVVFDGVRSGLFPVLNANDSGRYQMAVVAPNQPGEYILQTTVVQDGACWLEDVQPGIGNEFFVAVTKP